jgi:capsular polysaccharide export protein
LPQGKKALKNDLYLQTVTSNPALTALLQSRSVLMLQGPVGPFFDRLAQWLKDKGVPLVNRVAFSGGDVWDCKALLPMRFSGALVEWPIYLQNLISTFKVDCIVLFGQARPHHAKAMVYASLLGIKVVVVEEGYFRPHYLTMELGGVNGYSSTLERYSYSFETPPPAQELTVNAFAQSVRMGWYAAVHYAALSWWHSKFPFYQHHKNTSVLGQVSYWLRSWAKKAIHHRADTRKLASLEIGSYFFVPLQHDLDAQIEFHSAFGKNTDFIVQVMNSFALHAPSHSLLVIKQHPMSRGGKGHGVIVAAKAKELGISDRVVFLSEGKAGVLVKKALGVVCINSTVGLIALQQAKPLCLLGEAVYGDFDGVFKGGLDAFWHVKPQVQSLLCLRELVVLRQLTQMPGDLYAPSSTPLPWSPLL